MRCGVATIVVAAAAAAWFSQPRRADELLLLLRNASADFSLPSSASAAVALLPNASAAVALLRPNASAAFSFASSASATLGLPSDASAAFKRLSDASATLGLPSNASAAFKRLSEALVALGLPLDASAAFGLPLDASVDEAPAAPPPDASVDEAPPPAPSPRRRLPWPFRRRRGRGAPPDGAPDAPAPDPPAPAPPPADEASDASAGAAAPPAPRPSARGRRWLLVAALAASAYYRSLAAAVAAVALYYRSLFLGGFAAFFRYRSRPGDDGPAGPDRVELEVFRSDAAARSARFGADERDGVDALRRLVRDVKPDPPWLADDATLVRFLRARGGRRGAAEALWRAHVAWRASFGVDALVEGPPSPELALCRKWWPVGALAGRDRDGAPVDYHRLGAADLPGLEREVGRAAFLEFVAVLNEECFAGFRAASTDGAVHASGSVIMDMDGLGLRHLRAIPGALAALRLAEPNYPERLKRIFIVRAPPAFHAVYRALRPALNAGSADKVRVLDDGEAYDALLAHMPAATIPAELGGAGDASHIPRGGPVPVGELAFHRGFRSGAQLETPLGGAGGARARDVEPPPETPKKPKKPKTPRARR